MDILDLSQVAVRMTLAETSCSNRSVYKCLAAAQTKCISEIINSIFSENIEKISTY